MSTLPGVAVAGASGRMGRMLVEAIANSGDLRLAGALEHAHAAALGTDPAAFLGRSSGIFITADLDEALGGAQVLIDFTRPDATLSHLAACTARRIPAVVGTTGFSDEGRREIAAAATVIPIVFSPNMSIGMNVLFALVQKAARALPAEFDAEVFEAHHRLKVDAPSGTALKLGDVVAQARGQDLDAAGVFARHGTTGERPAGAIGFSAVRGGDIVGDHTVFFAGPGERIEITHRAGSRAPYAAGSLAAARFVMTAKPGLYDMHDVLGLR